MDARTCFRRRLAGRGEEVVDGWALYVPAGYDGEGSPEAVEIVHGGDGEKAGRVEAYLGIAALFADGRPLVFEAGALWEPCGRGAQALPDGFPLLPAEGPPAKGVAPLSPWRPWPLTPLTILRHFDEHGGWWVLRTPNERAFAYILTTRRRRDEVDIVRAYSSEEALAAGAAMAQGGGIWEAAASDLAASSPVGEGPLACAPLHRNWKRP